MKKFKVVKKGSGKKKEKKDLRSIIDRDKLFTMIYSGVENEKYFNQLYSMGIRDFLMSYHYLTTKSSKPLSNLKELGIRLFIDSGAHTYQNDEKYKDYTLDYWENHLKGYLDWARENKDVIFAIANFDFENLVSPEVVNEWNRKYFEPFMIETGIPVCFVWHQNSSRTWEEYCERYPYIGFSSVNTDGVSIEAKEYVEKLKCAEKHDSLVHGFGMTRTSILPKAPFYTCDSTTWLVGLQYGEINYWNGSKMSRLKKDKWKKEFLPKLVALGCDEDKLLAEDSEEMVKANLLAFIQAEKYIRERLKSFMYWLKPDINKPKSLDEIVFPTIDWLNGKGDFLDLEKYATTFNINPDHSDRQWIINCIIDCTVFCNWEDEIYQDMINSFYRNEKTIAELHDQHVNGVCADDEERIIELREFFESVVLGKTDKLLLAGTNFDREVKEREKYLEEEEFESVELSTEEIKERLSGLLTEGTEDIAPDITELDDEIYKEVGIVPVRDDKGKFLKGQTQIKKPKNIYSDKYPKMACDRCYASQRCVEYKQGMACAYNKLFKRFDTRNMSDLIEAMQSMVGLNLERMQRVAMFEILDGGLPDSNLTSFIDQNTRLISSLKGLYENGSAEVVRHSKVVKADGSQEETTQISNPQGGGILEKLFMSKAEPEKSKEPIVVEVVKEKGE